MVCVQHETSGEEQQRKGRRKEIKERNIMRRTGKRTGARSRGGRQGRPPRGPRRPRRLPRLSAPRSPELSQEGLLMALLSGARPKARVPGWPLHSLLLGPTACPDTSQCRSLCVCQAHSAPCRACLGLPGPGGRAPQRPARPGLCPQPPVSSLKPQKP